MSIGSRIYEIARTPFVFTAKAVDFFADGLTHIPETYRQSEGSSLERMTYAPIRSWFESFKDNVAGQASVTNDMTPGDSMFGMVMGPKGLIGATVEAIPEWVGPIPVRKVGGVVWTPFLENMQRVYKYGIDRPIGFLATVGNVWGLETKGETEDGGFNLPFTGGVIGQIPGVSNVLQGKPEDAPQRLANMIPGNWQQDDYDAVTLNLDTYKDVWDVTESRSAGQAIILSQQNIDIFDPVSVQDFEGTLYYQMASGTIDLYLNLAGDPGYLAVKGVKLGYGLRQARLHYAKTSQFRLPPNTVRAPFSVSDVRGKRRNALDRDEAAYQNLGWTPKWLKSPASNTSIQEVATQRPYMEVKQAVQDVLYQTLDETGFNVRGVDEGPPQYVPIAGLDLNQTIETRRAELQSLNKAGVVEQAEIVGMIMGDKLPPKRTTKANLIDWVLDREFIEKRPRTLSGVENLDPVYLTSGEGAVTELAALPDDPIMMTGQIDQLMTRIGEERDALQREFATTDRDALIANELEGTPYNTLDDIADALDDLWENLDDVTRGSEDVRLQQLLVERREHQRLYDDVQAGRREMPDFEDGSWFDVAANLDSAIYEAERILDYAPYAGRTIPGSSGQMPLEELYEAFEQARFEDSPDFPNNFFLDDEAIRGLGLDPADGPVPVTASLNTPRELFETVIFADEPYRISALLDYLGMDGAAAISNFDRITGNVGGGQKFVNWVERVLDLEDARYGDPEGQEFLAAQSRVDAARRELEELVEPISRRIDDWDQFDDFADMTSAAEDNLFWLDNLLHQIERPLSTPEGWARPRFDQFFDFWGVGLDSPTIQRGLKEKRIIELERLQGTTTQRLGAFDQATIRLMELKQDPLLLGGTADNPVFVPPTKTPTELVIDRLALNIMRAGKAGRFGQRWRRMPHDQAYQRAKIWATLANTGPVDSTSWLPFDNFLKLEVNAPAARQAMESQAHFLAAMFGGGDFQGFKFYLRRYATVNESIQQIQRSLAFYGDPELRAHAVPSPEDIQNPRYVGGPIDMTDELGLSDATAMGRTAYTTPERQLTELATVPFENIESYKQLGEYKIRVLQQELAFLNRKFQAEISSMSTKMRGYFDEFDPELDTEWRLHDDIEANQGSEPSIGFEDIEEFFVPPMGTPEFDNFISQLNQLDQMPWNAILNVKEDLLKTLIEEQPQLFSGPDKIPGTVPKYQEVVKGSESLIQVTTDQILDMTGIPLSPTGMLPYLGAPNRLGFSARTFIERSERYNNFARSRAVRIIVDKVSQGLVDWRNPSHAYVQVERMMRDFERLADKDGVPLTEKLREHYRIGWQETDVEAIARGAPEGVPNAYDGFVVDEVLAELLNKTDDPIAMRHLFEDVSQRMLNIVVDAYADIRDPITGKRIIDNHKVVQILRGDMSAADDLLKTSAERQDRMFGNGDNTTVEWINDGENIRRHIPIMPSQVQHTSIVPRFDMFQRLVNIVGDDYKTILDADGNPQRIHLGKSRAQVRVARRFMSTAWKRGVLLTPRWQMVVNIDSMLRTMAHVGTAATVGRLGNRMDTLQARWLRKSGVDVTRLIADEVAARIDEVGLPRETKPSYQPPQALPDDLVWAQADDAGSRYFGRYQTPGRHGSQFVEDVQEYNRLRESEPNHPVLQETFEELVEGVINTEYGRGRKMRRIGLTTGVGLFFGGPVGAAVAGLAYSKYSRNSLQALARRTIANDYAQALRLEAYDSLNRLEKLDEAVLRGYMPHNFRIRDFEALTPDELMMLDEGYELAEVLGLAAKDRREAARLISARADFIDDYQRNVVDAFRADQPELAGRFDEAAEILGDAGYGQTQFGNVSIDNAWGDIPQLQEVWERLNSANATARSVWAEETAAIRRSQRSHATQQYDIEVIYEQEAFAASWNEYIAHHAQPQGPASGIPHRDFMRPFWEGKSDGEIFGWLQREGADVLERLPEQWQTPEGMRQLIESVRYETDTLVPNLPEFREVRAKLARGESVRWDADMAPVLERIKKAQDQALDDVITSGTLEDALGGNRLQPAPNEFMDAPPLADLLGSFYVLERKTIANAGDRLPVEPRNVAQQLKNMSVVERMRLLGETQDKRLITDTQSYVNSLVDFGKSIGTSDYMDAIQEMSMRKRAVTLIDEFVTERFENLTMVEDVISRGTMFEAVYERTMAEYLQRHRNPDGTYTINGNQLATITEKSRQQALFETKNVLYDLAERSRFEELMVELMPFLGAWQEVASRWVGLAAANPVFVARALRPWYLLTSEDEHGQTKLVFKLPPVFDTSVAGFKLFGPISMLTKENVDLKLSSASMIGALPGTGPLFSFLTTELVIQVPEMSEFVDWALPYGYAEGGNAVSRFLNVHAPSWVRSGLQQAGMDTNSRAATAARVTLDYLSELHENGITVGDSAAERRALDEEVERRVKMIYGMRMFRSLAVPVSFRQQSPYWAIISEFHKMEDEHGAEIADYWLLENHPDLWAYTGRKYATNGVVAGTLEGHQKYLAHQEFADRYPEVGGFVTGAVGAIDVQFEYNRAVRDEEIRSGRKEYLDPGGILTESSESIGWREYRVFRNSLDAELRLRADSGGSASLNANSNFDLKTRKDQFVAELGAANPIWASEFNDIGNFQTQGRILQAFREIVTNEDFAYRPEIPVIEMFLTLHDGIGQEMVTRANIESNSNYLLLSYKKNDDLRQRWEIGVLSILRYPDFGPIYDRYFSKMESISTQNLPRRLELVEAT